MVIPKSRDNAPAREHAEVSEGPVRFSIAILILINVAIFAALIYSVVLGLFGE